MRLDSKSQADEHVRLGNELYERGCLPQARARYEAALEIAPNHTRAHFNLGVLKQRLDLPQEALGHYDAALQCDPTFARALVNSGNVLRDLGDIPAARQRYERGLALDPNDIHALNNLGSLAQDMGRLEDAEDLYELATAADAGFVDARFNVSLVRLRRGDYARGWEDYELRFATQPPVAVWRRFPRARLQPALTNVRRVAVWREQGVGDQILFSTLLPELVARGMHAVVEVDRRLVAAYRRSLSQLEFVAPEEAEEAFASCDHQTPLGSLPRLFRPSAESFAAQPRALLAAEPRRVAQARSALGSGFNVAISWRSLQPRGRAHTQARKSMPLECLAALALPGVQLVDLQYGDVGAERAAFDARHPRVRREIAGLDRFEDLEGVMAALAACDLVITTSNVTAHLAGALGKPTWLVYLDANPPFHYWVPDEAGRSRWYPSIEIVTDPAWDRWEVACAALGKRLSEQRRA